MSIPDATTFLDSHDLKLKPHKNYQAWKNAEKTAREIIRVFDQPSRREVIGKRFLEAIHEYLPEG